MLKMKSAALAVLLACGMVRADGVLEKLPAGALVGGRIANLQATSNKIAKLAKDLGIDAFVAQLQNPLANFKTDAHFEKGLNDAGEIGFAYLDPKTTGVGEQDAYVVLIPVTNYAEFVTNFEDAKTENGVTEFTRPNGPPKPMFLADWGGYAALSSAKEMLVKPTETMKPADATTKEAARQDLLVVANFKELAPKLMPELDEGMTKAMAELDKPELKDVDPKYKPLLKAVVSQAFAAGKTFLNSSDAATIGLNISDAGINSTVLSSFKADTYLGKVAGQMKGTDKPLTTGLPAVKFMAYGGSTLDPAVAGRVFDDLTKPVIAELEKIEGQDDSKKLVATARAAIGKMTGNVFAVPVPAAVGKEALLQQVVVYRGGGAELKALMTDGGSFAKKFIADMKLPEGGNKPVLEQVANAKTIEGVSFDRLHVETKPNPDAPNAAQIEQMQALFNGPEGATYQYGVMGNDLILANNATDETIAAFVKAAKGNEDNVSKLDQVKVVAAELPKTRSLEYYVALDEMVNTGVSTAAQFGLPIQVQLPPDLPPFGLTFGGEGTTLRIDTHLPTTTVQSLIAAGMQAFMGLRGGGGGNL